MTKEEIALLKGLRDTLDSMLIEPVLGITKKAINNAITELEQTEQQPSDDCISLEVYKQVAWERDIAVEQLKELGYSFGEKIRTSNDCVSIAELEKWLDLNFSFGGACRKLELFDRLEKELPRVTPTLPNGATNGDMIEAITDRKPETDINGNPYILFSKEWWNAPYKRGSEND